MLCAGDSGPIMVEEVKEGGDDSLSSFANGFLMMVVWEDSEEEEEVWSRCSQCTLAQ